MRMQEVFGLAATPRIGGGAVPVTFKLLSPGAGRCRSRAISPASGATPTWRCARTCAGDIRGTTGRRIRCRPSPRAAPSRGRPGRPGESALRAARKCRRGTRFARLVAHTHGERPWVAITVCPCCCSQLAGRAASAQPPKLSHPAADPVPPQPASPPRSATRSSASRCRYASPNSSTSAISARSPAMAS